MSKVATFKSLWGINYNNLTNDKILCLCIDNKLRLFDNVLKAVSKDDINVNNSCEITQVVYEVIKINSSDITELNKLDKILNDSHITCKINK